MSIRQYLKNNRSEKESKEFKLHTLWEARIAEEYDSDRRRKDFELRDHWIQKYFPHKGDLDNFKEKFGLL